MIKSKELARIKSSQEDVFVLKIENDLATVRRPIGGQNGITHLTEQFTLAELETLDESRTRAMAEQFNMQQKFAQMSGSNPTSGTSSLQ